MGIAALAAIETGAAERITFNRLADHRVEPTASQIDRFEKFLLEAEQKGLRNTEHSVRVFGRRCRWLWMSSGLGPGITRRSPDAEG